MTDLRACFEVRTGALKTMSRLATVLEGVARVEAICVPEHLGSLVRERHTHNVLTPATADTLASGDWLLLNGRCVLPFVQMGELTRGHALVDAEGDLIAAHVGHEQAAAILRGEAVPAEVMTQVCEEPCMIRWPWEVIRHRDAALAIDLRARRLAVDEITPAGVVVIGESGVHIAPTADVFPSVIVDATRGPVVVESGVTVRPGAILCGPCWLGPDVTVLDRALIKGGTAIGPHSKVAGEVGGTIFQGYSNKAHDGHLGDSWLGEWVNLGADTTNSNLLNTYGDVVMRLTADGSRHRTGLQFLGCIVGDHVKFAIGTRIMTGSVFGTGAMVATSTAPPTTVAPFAWLTDAGASTYRLPKFMAVARTVMARRGIEPSEAYEAQLGAIADGAKA